MLVTRAYALLPVLPTDLPSLEPCLEHLVAAADEAAAAGVPTSLVLATSLLPAVLVPVLADWNPLVDLLDGVDLTVDQQQDTRTRDALRAKAARTLSHTLADPTAAVVLTTTCAIGVGPDWIAEHVRHHRAGARASTGPVRGHHREEGGHQVGENLAVRADLLPSGALTPTGLQQIPLVHAVTPVVSTLRVTLQAFP